MTHRWNQQTSLVLGLVLPLLLAGTSASADSKLRIGSYNVFWGSSFPSDDGSPPVAPEKHGMKPRTENFVRIHNAVNADIWAFQELLYSNVEKKKKSAEGIQRYFQEVTAEDWHMAADNKGRLVLSRYPIVWHKSLVLSAFAMLIDLPQSISKEDLLLITVHLHWNNPDQRKKEAQAVARFLQEVMNGDVGEVPANSLLLVCGDFNSVPDDPPYRIISAADPDVAMPGDVETVLLDSYPVHLEGTSRATIGSVVFQNGSMTVHGATIDFILFRPGALEISDSFILNSLTLDQTVLDDLGLKRNDVAVDPDQALQGAVSFDHLPLIADFSSTDVDTDGDADADGDADTDSDGDADADSDSDADADTDGDSDSDTDSDTEADTDGDGDSDSDADDDSNNDDMADVSHEDGACGCNQVGAPRQTHPIAVMLKMGFAS